MSLFNTYLLLVFSLPPPPFAKGVALPVASYMRGPPTIQTYLPSINTIMAWACSTASIDTLFDLWIAAGNPISLHDKDAAQSAQAPNGGQETQPPSITMPTKACRAKKGFTPTFMEAAGGLAKMLYLQAHWPKARTFSNGRFAAAFFVFALPLTTPGAAQYVVAWGAVNNQSAVFKKKKNTTPGNSDGVTSNIQAFNRFGRIVAIGNCVTRCNFFTVCAPPAEPVTNIAQYAADIILRQLAEGGAPRTPRDNRANIYRFRTKLNESKYNGGEEMSKEAWQEQHLLKAYSEKQAAFRQEAAAAKKLLWSQTCAKKNARRAQLVAEACIRQVTSSLLPTESFKRGASSSRTNMNSRTLKQANTRRSALGEEVEGAGAAAGAGAGKGAISNTVLSTNTSPANASPGHRSRTTRRRQNKQAIKCHAAGGGAPAIDGVLADHPAYTAHGRSEAPSAVSATATY